MKLKFIRLVQSIKGNFWSYPLIICIVAIGIMVMAVAVDMSLATFHLWDEYIHYNITHVRTLLGTMITTVVTMTSVTLSITVLTLSIAGNQLGPRLLPNVIRAGTTQFVIGLFIGVFIYCLLLMLVASSTWFSGKPIFISFYIAVILAISAFVALVYFIHFVSNAIQVEYVLNTISTEIANCMDREFSHQEHQTNVSANILEKPAGFTKIQATSTGYIQTLNYQSMLDIAIEHHCVIELYKRPGHFIFENEIIAMVYHDGELNNISSKINQQIVTNIRRTSIQDLEFGFDQISEIAVRALSPGINNPYAAILCVHKLGYLLSRLGQKAIQPSMMQDEHHVCRVLYQGLSYESICDIALNQIRQNAKNMPSVQIELIRMINAVNKTNPPEPLKEALNRQKQMIIDMAKHQDLHQDDLKAILEAN